MFDYIRSRVVGIVAHVNSSFVGVGHGPGTFHRRRPTSCPWGVTTKVARAHQGVTADADADQSSTSTTL
ncbi:MAG: hypothetical protein WKF43_12595, partial [Acidimicrobiales bacterium]